MELHHSKHHQTYVNGLNSALEAIAEAEAKGDFTKAASLAPLLNFHGGGHLNHTLFWENLAPASREGGGEPDGALKVRSSNPVLFKLSRQGAVDKEPLADAAFLVKNRKPSRLISAPSRPSASK